MISETDAKEQLNQLADEIAKTVDNPAVIAAFRAVQRHRFLMQGFHVFDRPSSQMKHNTLENTALDEWLKLAYSNHALMIALGDNPSSSSEPVLMAMMLDALELKAGMRVLEIGTGTGYNAALLATLVGESGEVVSIDRQAHLCEAADSILKEIVGERVKVIAGDGLLGVPELAPYDRIITTASHTEIAPAWIEQLAIGGKLLGNIGVGGGLLLLERGEKTVEGHYLEQAGYFMPMIEDSHVAAEISIEGLDFDALKTTHFRFFLDWLFPDVYFSEMAASANTEERELQFHARDGKTSALLSSSGRLKMLRGNESFLEQMRQIIERWEYFGKPKRSDFGVRVEADGRQLLTLKSEALGILSRLR